METAGFAVRSAIASDKAGILRLAPRLAEGVAPWRDRTEALVAGRRWLEGSIAAASAGDAAVFVAVTEDGDVAAVISVKPSRHFTGESDGYVGELVVDEQASRRGLGAALIEAADAWGREHGLRNLTLHTGIHNTDARAFYAALGFVEEEVRLTREITRP